MAIRQSLFDPGANPVLPAATDWVGGALFGDVATSLCVIAVAFVGLMLLTGRLAVREGLRVAIGCFVLLGAPSIAMGLRSAADGTASAVSPTIVNSAEPAVLPAAPAYDPYAGASLRNYGNNPFR